MNRLCFISIVVFSLICFAACKGRTSGGNEAAEADETELIDASAALTGEDLTFSQRSKNLVEQELAKQLDSLANGLWNPAEYKRLSDWLDGDELDLKYSARTSFQSLLDADYCISMDNEARKIMGGASCGKSHDRLKKIMAERSKFDEGRTSIGKAVRTAYSHHEEMSAIVSSFYAKQPVKSFLDKYDLAFESTKKAEGSKAFAKYHPVCSYLQALNSPNFSSRRKDYCEKILTLYEQHVRQDGKVDDGDYNEVDGNLYIAYGKDHPAEMTGWRNNRLEVLKQQVSSQPQNN